MSDLIKLLRDIASSAACAGNEAGYDTFEHIEEVANRAADRIAELEAELARYKPELGISGRPLTTGG